MPVVRVRADLRTEEIAFTTGQSLREVLERAMIPVRFGCNGNGSCGLCRVRITSGIVPDPSLQEFFLLGGDDRESGVRLACCVRPGDDLSIEIAASGSHLAWRSLPQADEGVETPTAKALAPTDHGSAGTYGVAVDLGTSQISVSLLDLGTGRRLAGRHGTNPQAALGADVMTRLVAAAGSGETAFLLRDRVVRVIGDGLADIASRDGIDLSRLARLALVGNTAMLALLSGRNYALLVRPETWMGTVDCLPVDTDDLAVAWETPSAEIRIHPPLAGFVGSDLLAGVLATGMTEREEPALLIDFGTNSEIALWDGQALSVTSAAGGPAFEGSGMRCGLPAVPGAICRVEFRNRAVECTTIGGAPARGLCGTGLVDLIAHLLRTGILSERGRLSGGHDKGYILPDGDPPLVLTGKDVDLFQRAKAAVGSGVQVLMERAGISGDELGHVYVCGTFGYGLDTGNAREIGLLPMVPEDRISLCGNTALAGCEELLLDPKADGRLEAIRRSAELVNLARLPDFEELFLANLYLSPLGGA